jgi:pimeloyl-ACP methyl ester carboxylesterase
MRAWLVALALIACAPAWGEDRLLKVDTRPGVTLGYWWMDRPGATATVVLLPGGNGVIGYRDGGVHSINFLVRTRDDFAAAGFNVAIVGRPSDRTTQDPAWRMSEEHMADLRAVVERVKRQGKAPVWIVGTSLGTYSAAAAAIALGPGVIAGVVLTSTITDSARFTTVPNMALGEIRMPVLVMHHEKDACLSCPARLVPPMMERLANAPVKKLMMVDGGSGARGDPCEPMHWHGFVGREKEAVAAITAWIRNPR